MTRPATGASDTAARRPFAVVAFTGTPIFGERPRSVTDWHVVDRRGCTVRVYPYTMGAEVAIRQYRAERYARRLNGTLGAIGSRDGVHWSCRLCGKVVCGPRRG